MLLTYLRSLLAVVEEGSINSAARRLQVSQPALSRQMQALEQLVGGRLFERSPAGVRPTAAGHRLVKSARSVLAAADHAVAEARLLARGESGQLRIGCVLSAAQPYMAKALLALRASHPEFKTTLRDQTPGEQIAALRAGEFDLALIGQEGAVLCRDFYTRVLAKLPVLAAVPDDHPLARQTQISLRDLRGELFIGYPEDDMPGRNRWITGLCRKAGFRARFGPEADSLAQTFASVVAEPGVTLVPNYLRANPYPGVTLLPLKDKSVTWDLLVVWPPGRSSPALQALLDTLTTIAKAG